MPPQEPDGDWSLRRSYCVTWLAATIGLSLLYAILRYNVFNGVEWIHLPLYIVNKAVGLSAVVLLSSSYLVGKWIKVWEGDPTKRLVLIKFLGLAGFAVAGLHIIMSLILLNPAYFAKFFGDGKLNLTGELAMLFGALSILFLVSPAISSLPNMKEELGLRRWKRSQRTGYIALQLNSLHLLAMGWKGWIDVTTWPGGMPPLTLVAFRFGILPVIARYTSGSRS